MKKNAMLKIAAILMVAVLLTTCAISSTFAKYVTEAKDAKTNEASVAVWGVTITPAADSALFLTAYGSTEDKDVVCADTEAFVIAPGTTNSASLLNFELYGTPEVDFQLVANAEVVLGGDWTVDTGSFYCPLVFEVEGVGSVDGRTYYGNDTDFKAAIKALIAKAILNTNVYDDDKGATKKFEAGQTLSANAVGAPVVTWTWNFDASGNQTDARDTDLADNSATIQFTYSLGAEQVSAD